MTTRLEAAIREVRLAAEEDKKIRADQAWLHGLIYAVMHLEDGGTLEELQTLITERKKKVS